MVNNAIQHVFGDRLERGFKMVEDLQGQIQVLSHNLECLKMDLPRLVIRE
jgi:hypothetical protein